MTDAILRIDTKKYQLSHAGDWLSTEHQLMLNRINEHELEMKWATGRYVMRFKRPGDLDTEWADFETFVKRHNDRRKLR